jgi:hypothetical protein
MSIRERIREFLSRAGVKKGYLDDKVPTSGKNPSKWLLLVLLMLYVLVIIHLGMTIRHQNQNHDGRETGFGIQTPLDLNI